MTNDPSVSLSEDSGAGPAVLLLSGVVDVFQVGKLYDVACQCAKLERDTRVDCRALERLDAACVQVLLSLEKQLDSVGRKLSVSNASQKVQTYLANGGASGLIGEALPAGPGAPNTEPAASAGQREGGEPSPPPSTQAKAPATNPLPTLSVPAVEVPSRDAEMDNPSASAATASSVSSEPNATADDRSRANTARKTTRRRTKPTSKQQAQ